jgi:cell division control protein 6
VFCDREKLFPRYIPGALPHREPQMRVLQDLFMEFLRRPGEAYQRVVQLLGPIGAGKTCTANRFCLQYQREAEEKGISLKYVHVNCKLEARSSFTLYRTLLETAAPEVASRGQSPGEMLRLLVDHLRSEGMYLLLVLDDVDYLIRRQKGEEPEGGVVYDLTRLNEMHLGEPGNVVGVIFIARDEGFRDLLDPSEVSSLGSVVVRLSGYDAGQLWDILAARVEEAFRPGAVEEGDHRLRCRPGGGEEAPARGLPLRPGHPPDSGPHRRRRASRLRKPGARKDGGWGDLLGDEQRGPPSAGRA